MGFTQYLDGGRTESTHREVCRLARIVRREYCPTHRADQRVLIAVLVDRAVDAFRAGRMEVLDFVLLGFGLRDHRLRVSRVIN